MGVREAEAVADAARAALLTGGPTLARFEAALAERVGARHAIAVSSGTAALHVAYLAAGLDRGDTVLTTPLTFVATANAAAYCGAVPRFADVDAHGALAPEAVARAVAEGPPPRLVVPVHWAGHPAEVEAIAVAAPDALVVEDACHALGAEYRDATGAVHSVGACAHSAMAVFSFHPVKTITTGEGGAITTNDALLAERCRRLRDHGLVRDPSAFPDADGPWCYALDELGFNYRLTDLQAALGLVQLGRLEEFAARRAALAEAYAHALGAVPSARLVAPRAGTRSAWHLLPVRVPAAARRAAFDRLRAAGIGVQVHYVPVHLQPYYRRLLGSRPGDCPAAEALYREELSLPCFPEMEVGAVVEVVAALGEAIADASRAKIRETDDGRVEHPLC